MVYRNSGNFYSYSSFRGWYVLPTKINLPEIKINIASVLPSGAPYEIKKNLSMKISRITVSQNPLYAWYC